MSRLRRFSCRSACICVDLRLIAIALHPARRLPFCFVTRRREQEVSHDQSTHPIASDALVSISLLGSVSSVVRSPFVASSLALVFPFVAPSRSLPAWAGGFVAASHEPANPRA